MNRKWIIGKSIFLFFTACLIIVGVAFTIQSVRATVSKDQPRRFEARNGEFFLIMNLSCLYPGKCISAVCYPKTGTTV